MKGMLNFLLIQLDFESYCQKMNVNLRSHFPSFDATEVTFVPGVSCVF